MSWHTEYLFASVLSIASGPRPTQSGRYPNRHQSEWPFLNCESFFSAKKPSSRSPMNVGNVSMEDWKSKRSLTLNNVNMAAPNETVKNETESAERLCIRHFV